MVSVIAYNSNTCFDSHTGITTSVNALPAPSILSGSNIVCELETVNYTTDAIGSINWIVTEGTIQSGQGTNTVSVRWNNIFPVEISTPGSIRIEETIGGCKGSGNLNVTINRVPQTGPTYYIRNSLLL